MSDILFKLRDARPQMLDPDSLARLVGADRASVLIALDALLQEGSISGVPLRSTKGLDDMANIRITPEAYRELYGRSNQPSTTYITHVHGSVGAVGSNAQGIVNYQQCWSEIQSSVDLDALATQFATLRNEIQRNANSPSDYETMGALAEAERHAQQHEGSKMLAALSKVGKMGLDLALKAGTDLAARIIERALQGQMS